MKSRTGREDLVGREHGCRRNREGQPFLLGHECADYKQRGRQNRAGNEAGAASVVAGVNTTHAEAGNNSYLMLSQIRWRQLSVSRRPGQGLKGKRKEFRERSCRLDFQQRRYSGGKLNPFSAKLSESAPGSWRLHLPASTRDTPMININWHYTGCFPSIR